jgi:hypothetical protein
VLHVHDFESSYYVNDQLKYELHVHDFESSYYVNDQLKYVLQDFESSYYVNDQLKYVLQDFELSYYVNDQLIQWASRHAKLSILSSNQEHHMQFSLKGYCSHSISGPD